VTEPAATEHAATGPARAISAAEAGASAATADTTRERLLRAAAAVLAERGYGQTRLGEVASRAGLRPPAVYYYFDSRDDLVAEVMRVGQRRAREHVEDAVRATAGGWLDRVDAAVEAHLRIQLELSDFAAAVTRNAGHVPAPVRAALQEESDGYHDTWRRLLAGARRAGELRDDLDPTVARMLVIGALNWAVEWWRPELSVDAVVATACRMIHQALAPIFDS
jgi:AcrR family transcriptional regulator